MLYLDIETYSELDVTEVGAHAYAAHPTTEVLLICYAIDNSPIYLIDFAADGVLPQHFVDAFAHEELCAHNCEFERVVLNATMHEHLPHTSAEDWHDTAVLSRTCGLPGKLETVCDVLGVAEGQRKLKGSRYIQLFCKPAPKNHKRRRYTAADKPDEWAEFIDYCAADVLACRHLWHVLPHYVYNSERENWIIDQQINDRGLPVDIRFIRAALALVDSELRKADERVREITGGAVSSVNAVGALGDYCGMVSVAKDAVEHALAHRDLSPEVREVLELRRTCGLASTAKFQRALLSAVDGRVRGALMFYGAVRTGRESGQQVQPQNMKRPEIHGEALAVARAAVLNGTADLLYDNPIEVLSSLVRSLIAVKPGRKLVVTDLSNIEGRKAAWLTDETWKLDAFRAFDAGEGPDLYRLSYARSFAIPVEQVSSDQRQVGKVQELALQYQGAIGAFNSMAVNYGVTLPDDEVYRVVQFWRGAHPRMVKYWYALERTAIDAVNNPGKTFTLGKLKLGMHRRGSYVWLVLLLPSGRGLMYFEPRVTTGDRGPKLSYTGQIIGSKWGRIDTYGGKLFENATQASARDVLMSGIARAEAAGYPVVLHSHDEIVAECYDDPAFTVDELSACLAQHDSWYEGLPLAAKGYEDVFYRKD